MANASLATPNPLYETGFLYWAPLGSALPTPTSTASQFSDTWPVAWIYLGMTESGSTISSNITVQPVPAAEIYDPLAYRTTDRASSVTFMLKNFSATNLQRALNGAVSTVTGSGATTITKLDPPQPGQEVRCMIGWESTDSTVRFIGYQAINSGNIDIAMAKAPANANIPFTLNLEKPSSAQPFSWWTAGVARA
jgi:hypothetical protein